MSHGLLRTRVMENRAYDHHYDPIFVHSGDRIRQGGIPAWTNSTNVINTGGPNVQKGNYRVAPTQNMQFRATQIATVPAIMPDGTIGRMPAPAAAAATAAATGTNTAAAPVPPRVRGLMGPMSSAQVLGQLSSEVRGRSRVKFFKRPVVPYLEAPGMEGIADDQAAAAAAEAFAANQLASSSIPQVEESHRTYGTQSDYRESETQTDPYTPDYITAPEEPEPEILGLAHLTYGSGLPASMAELKLIERMREKRAFEASLPPITDASSFEKRKMMLEARELAEWKLREEEIKEEQEARLHVLVDTLKTRENKIEELSEARVDLVRAAALRERDIAFDSIHRERIKFHRSLGKNRMELDSQTAHMSGGIKELTSSKVSNRRTGLRDIVGDYSDYSSQVYAPIQRQGKLPVKNQVVDYGIPLLNNFQGLNQLEKNLPNSIIGGGGEGKNGFTSIAPPLRPDGRIAVPSLVSRKGQSIRRDLEYVDNLLNQQRAEGNAVGIIGEARTQYGKQRRLIENVYKKFEPVQRAPTPTVSAPDDEEISRSILLLQRLLRGRMVQNDMYEGKQHAYELIKELREEERIPLELQEDPDSNLHHSLDILQGELISNTYSFVSNEVIRRKQEISIEHIVKQAELERRHRESEESGRRQSELIMRLKREKQLELVMEDHSLTADRFIKDIIKQSVDRYSINTAIRENEIQSRVVEPILTSIERSQQNDIATIARNESNNNQRNVTDEPDSESSRIIVGDIVNNFLLPEVERRKESRKEELKERRFGNLAHQTIFNTIAQLNGIDIQQEQTQQLQQQQEQTQGEEEEEEEEQF
jgi:hypothetical protein